MKEWASLKGPFLALVPITEIIKIKHSFYYAFTRKMISTTGDWEDKTELFCIQLRRHSAGRKCAEQNGHLGSARSLL